MTGTFAGCSLLKNAPIIPKNVKNCSKMFSFCINLSGNFILNSNPIEDWDSILWGAVSESGCTLKLYGECPDLQLIASNYNSYNSNISLGE